MHYFTTPRECLEHAVAVATGDEPMQNFMKVDPIPPISSLAALVDQAGDREIFYDSDREAFHLTKDVTQGKKLLEKDCFDRLVAAIVYFREAISQIFIQRGFTVLRAAQREWPLLDGRLPPWAGIVKTDVKLVRYLIHAPKNASFAQVFPPDEDILRGFSPFSLLCGSSAVYPFDTNLYTDLMLQSEPLGTLEDFGYFMECLRIKVARIFSSKGIDVLRFPQNQWLSHGIMSYMPYSPDKRIVDTDLLYKKSLVSDPGPSPHTHPFLANHPGLVRERVYKFPDGKGTLTVVPDLSDRFLTLGHCFELSELEKAKLILDTALALRDCHSTGLVHRDIKPPNCFVSAESHPALPHQLRSQLFDFECSVSATDSAPIRRLGTFGFTPLGFPELHHLTPRDPYLDVFALITSFFSILFPPRQYCDITDPHHYSSRAEFVGAIERFFVSMNYTFRPEFYRSLFNILVDPSLSATVDDVIRIFFQEYGFSSSMYGGYELCGFPMDYHPSGQAVRILTGEFPKTSPLVMYKENEGCLPDTRKEDWVGEF